MVIGKRQIQPLKGYEEEKELNYIPSQSPQAKVFVL